VAVVRYLVHDVDAALPFYRALGFELTERWGPPFAMLALGDLTIWLSGPGTSAARTLSDGSAPAPGGWNRFVVEVRDIEAAIAAIRAAGARFRGDPVSGPGGTQILVEDPSGNPIELFQAAG